MRSKPLVVATARSSFGADPHAAPRVSFGSFHLDIHVALPRKISVARRERLPPKRRQFNRRRQRGDCSGSDWPGISRRKTSNRHQCADDDRPKTPMNHPGSPSRQGNPNFHSIIANRREQNKTPSLAFQSHFTIGAGSGSFVGQNGMVLASSRSHSAS
jgi:hypothetical protein